MDDLIDSSEFAENFHFDQDLDKNEKTMADLEDLKDLTEQMEFWVNGVALTVTSISGIISMFLVWPDIFFSFHNHTLHIELQIIIFALSCFEETLWQLFFFTKLVQINILIIFTLMYKKLYDVLVIYFL